MFARLPAIIQAMRFPALRRLALACIVGASCSGPAAAQTIAVPAKSGVTAPIASFDSAWAAVARTYWDTAFIATRWRPAHDSIRRGLGADADAAAVRAAIRVLIALPRQSHFVLLPAAATPTSGAAGPTDDARPGTVGLDLRAIGQEVVVWRVVPGGAAAHAGIRAGDVIRQLDTLTVGRIRATLHDAMPNDPAKADALVTTLIKARLGGHVGDTLRLVVAGRRGRSRAHALIRTPLSGRLTQFGNLPPIVVTATAARETVRVRGQPRGAPARTVALIAWSAWFPALSPTLDTLFFANRDVDALILDLRGNPGGVIGMIAGISGHVLDSVVSLGELRSRGGLLRFSSNPRRADGSGHRSAPFGGPIAIIVDEFSASTTEFFASGMQALGRARIFGSTSAGQALPAAMGRLPSGDVLMHVIADHSDARGRRVEGIGVVPDQSSPLRISDLRAGRDAALDAARAWIAAGSP